MTRHGSWIITYCCEVLYRVHDTLAMNYKLTRTVQDVGKPVQESRNPVEGFDDVVITLYKSCDGLPLFAPVCEPLDVGVEAREVSFDQLATDLLISLLAGKYGAKAFHRVIFGQLIGSRIVGSAN